MPPTSLSTFTVIAITIKTFKIDLALDLVGIYHINNESMLNIIINILYCFFSPNNVLIHEI